LVNRPSGSVSAVSPSRPHAGLVLHDEWNGALAGLCVCMCADCRVPTRGGELGTPSPSAPLAAAPAPASASLKRRMLHVQSIPECSEQKPLGEK
jgi:hypothetical protein